MNKLDTGDVNGDVSSNVSSCVQSNYNTSTTHSDFQKGNSTHNMITRYYYNSKMGRKEARGSWPRVTN